ncbi:MAG: 1-acyl-sn-glycerol-3-phosphate acyltransferase [Acidimicrobiia bacterium]|nr:1-acyl-sn-glycerol-3-phosphate acyltransferase [Acidimicrobiia bacterium]
MGSLSKLSPAKVTAQLPFPYRAPTVPRGVEPLPEEPKLGAHYDTDWARRFPARWARAVILEAALRPAVRVLADPERRGYDRLAGLEPPVIFAANHHSHVDAGLLLTSLPEPFRYKVFAAAAADYFFVNRVAAAASALALGAIPIERSEVTRRSADQSAALLDDGWNMVIFPEGGRSPDGWGQHFRGGAAYLSTRCGVPVVPVHMEGTGRILPKGRNRPRPGRTRVTFGTPMRPADGESSRRYAARIEDAVAALADEVSHDWYTARVRAHAGQSPDLTGADLGGWRRTWALGDRKPIRARKRRWPDL